MKKSYVLKKLNTKEVLKLEEDLIGKVFESNGYGKYKVISFDRKDQYYQEYYKIRFLDTGYETISQKPSIYRGSVRDKTGTEPKKGDICKSKNCGKFKIISDDFRDNNRNVCFKVKFLSTGYITVAQKSHINRGKVKDYLYPSVHGVGFLGEDFERGKFDTRMHYIWRAMLSRCYNSNDSAYKSYGAKGVTVCKRWHNLSNFVKDIPLVDGYNKNLFDKGKLHLDKDIKQTEIPINEKIYSKETCKFVTPSENNRFRKCMQKDFKAISPKGEVYYHYDQTKFARKHNLSQANISEVLRGKWEQYRGWTFEYVEKDE